MHLGRFHKVVWDIDIHFKNTKLVELFERCASALDNYNSNKSDAQLAEFRSVYESLVSASRSQNPDLLAPYAQEVIAELHLERFFDPQLVECLEAIVAKRGFDAVGMAADFRQQANDVKGLVEDLDRITTAFSKLDVELQAVSEPRASEVGVLLPRSVVGETIPELTAEFQKFGRLFHAINELTGAESYDPRIRTISSSGWQIFLELSPEQIAAWVVILERIVNLFKTNLDIKKLQKDLAAKEMPKEITEAIGSEIDKRISASLEELADDVFEASAKPGLDNRGHELKNQLRQGIRHLAHRLSQGTQVEINMAVPDEPKDEPIAADGAIPDPDLRAQITAQRTRIAELRLLQGRAIDASHATVIGSAEPQPLLEYFTSEDEAAPK
jgi:hypothetical protein